MHDLLPMTIRIRSLGLLRGTFGMTLQVRLQQKSGSKNEFSRKSNEKVAFQNE
jgi:hypothetical protein